MRHKPTDNLGRWLGPPRFIVFVFLMLAMFPSLIDLTPITEAFLLSFDFAAMVFILSAIPLFIGVEARHMREAARQNDANRWLLLAISSMLSLAVLSAIVMQLGGKEPLGTPDILLLIGSLAIAWLFGNLIYAMHYAHVFYVQNAEGKDTAGIRFPKTAEPDYWDFLYFACTLGMTFQTSDVVIESQSVRRIAIFHCLAAFVFNIGVLAFTINVLGG